ncbi:MAG TPA: flavodoxin domain-containing protein [Opitutaceae bacterium]|jgi:sulfite reductase (NADPH) flavoprotein alpha-component
MTTAAPPAPPAIPENAPFTPEQRAWLNGFIAGVFARAAASGAPPTAEKLQPLTILFGSQTGTAEALARRAAKAAGNRGFAAAVLDMAQVSAAKLSQNSNVLLITSTHGDGEPPDNARALHAALRADGAPPLGGINYSVCALGDTNYTQFCRAGREFDEALEKLGASRCAARVDCDLDYEKPFAAWLDAALGSLGAAEAASSPAPAQAEAVPAGPSRSKPHDGLLTASRLLNGAGSAKQVHHVEFSLGESGMAYEAGDALGVWPANCPSLVSEIVARLGCDGEEAVNLSDGSATSLRCALSAHFDLGRPSADLAARFSAPAQGTPMHVVDLLAARQETRLRPEELVRMLRPLAPRLYSISSSPAAHRGSVHLTVAAVRYEAHGRGRKGVCSTMLADRVVPGEFRTGIYIQPNPSFRLPRYGDTPIIMVGPGTGVAPFRGFLHERRAAGAKGKSWLFFGDQHAATDFLYSDELLEMQRGGDLTRLDSAFSRDQEAKLYVQHRMLERASELYAWLEEGAHFYVCGDASRMAKDVEAALLEIVAKGAGFSPDRAREYVEALRSSRRYCRDVY